MSGGVQLRGSAWDHTRGYDPMVATAAAFQREHSGVEIVWEKRSLHEFGHAAVDRLAERYDLVVLDHPWVGRMAATQSYLPLEELLPHAVLADLARQSVGPSHRSYEWNGHQWALAIDAATLSASYRADLLAADGGALPRTWAEVLDLGRRCRARGRWIACPLGPVDAISAFLSLADNIDARPFATPGVVVDHAAGQRVLAALRELVALCPPDTFQLTPITLMERMSRTDEIVYCPLAYGYSNYSRPGYRPRVCAYADMPALGDDGPRGSHLGGTGLAISARCRHRELAAEYAARVAAAAWQRTIYFQSGGQPAHAAAWDDDECNAATGGFFHNTRQTIVRAFLRPRYDGYIRFQYEAGAWIGRELQHGLETGEALLTRLDGLYRETLSQ